LVSDLRWADIAVLEVWDRRPGLWLGTDSVRQL
jgi:hypothetical protein